MNISQVHKLSRASQLSLLAVVILLGAIFFTVNGALQEQNTAGHASTGTNYLLNPSFESGKSPWYVSVHSGAAGTFNVTNSTTESGNYSADLNITTSNSNNWWYVQLVQDTLPMVAGQTYTVSFWAKGSSNRPIQSDIQQQGGAWTVYKYFDTNITTSWQQYTYTFTANTSATVYIEFNVANVTGNVWIDNVSYSNGNAALPTATPVPPTKVPTPIPTLVLKPTPTSLPTLIPTAFPTDLPQPTATPEPTATPQPTDIPQPTDTPVPGSTVLSLDVGLHGIGNGGDSASPGSQGNMNPLHPERTVTADIYDTQNQLVVSQQGTITYDSNSGRFSGTVNLGTNFATGLYTVKIKTDQYLRALVPGIQSITSGQTTTLPAVTLVDGDINGDNAINIVDYNILIGCYSDLLPPTDCPSGEDVAADITDDGHVNQFDYNLFLRELTNIGGQ